MLFEPRPSIAALWSQIARTRQDRLLTPLRGESDDTHAPNHRLGEASVLHRSTGMHHLAIPRTGKRGHRARVAPPRSPSEPDCIPHAPPGSLGLVERSANAAAGPVSDRLTRFLSADVYAPALRVHARSAGHGRPTVDVDRAPVNRETKSGRRRRQPSYREYRPFPSLTQAE